MFNPKIIALKNKKSSYTSWAWITGIVGFFFLWPLWIITGLLVYSIIDLNSKIYLLEYEDTKDKEKK